MALLFAIKEVNLPAYSIILFFTAGGLNNSNRAGKKSHGRQLRRNNKPYGNACEKWRQKMQCERDTAVEILPLGALKTQLRVITAIVSDINRCWWSSFVVVGINCCQFWIACSAEWSVGITERWRHFTTCRQKTACLLCCQSCMTSNSRHPVTQLETGQRAN